MSFFGFDTSKPADKEVIFEGEGSRYDELLESKFAVPIDQDKDRIIMDDDEELNDETFGDVGDITTDFDFGKGGSNQVACFLHLASFTESDEPNAAPWNASNGLPTNLYSTKTNDATK